MPASCRDQPGDQSAHVWFQKPRGCAFDILDEGLVGSMADRWFCEWDQWVVDGRGLRLCGDPVWPESTPRIVGGCEEL